MMKAMLDKILNNKRNIGVAIFFLGQGLGMFNVITPEQEQWVEGVGAVIGGWGTFENTRNNIKKKQNGRIIK